MRKLVRHVTRPSRLRRHHVLLAIVGLGLLVHEANAALHWFGESKQEVARATERHMLDEYELWSYHSCPNDVADFHGENIDPWGSPYQVVCTQARDRVTLAIVSLGPDDGQAHDDLTTVQSFSP
jgi:hypothetical protein